MAKENMAKECTRGNEAALFSCISVAKKEYLVDLYMHVWDLRIAALSVKDTKQIDSYNKKLREAITQLNREIKPIILLPIKVVEGFIHGSHRGSYLEITDTLYSILSIDPFMAARLKDKIQERGVKCGN